MQVRALDISARRVPPLLPIYILAREVLPNIVRPLAVVATLRWLRHPAQAACRSLPGRAPPLAVWGLMIAEARTTCSSAVGDQDPGRRLVPPVLGINCWRRLSQILGTDRAGMSAVLGGG